MEIVLRDKDTANAVALLHPGSGEVIDLATATRDQLAEWFVAVKGWQESAAAAQQLASERFVQLTDKEASLSVRVDDYRVSVPGPGLTFSLDKSLLRQALLALVADDRLTQDAADAACAPTGKDCPHCGGFVHDGGYSVNQAAVNNLRKQADLDAVIDGCGEYYPKPRPLSAKRV